MNVLGEDDAVGAHLEDLSHLVEVKGETATLLSASVRARHLFGKDNNVAATPKRKKKAAPANVHDEYAASSVNVSLPLPFRLTKPGSADFKPYEKCVPLTSLRAAAGAWSDGQSSLE